MQQIPELVQELNLRGTTNAVCVATVKFTLDQLDGTFDADHPAPGKLAPQIEDLRTSYGAMNTAYAEQMKRSETAEIAALDQEGDQLLYGVKGTLEAAIRMTFDQQRLQLAQTLWETYRKYRIDPTENMIAEWAKVQQFTEEYLKSADLQACGTALSLDGAIRRLDAIQADIRRLMTERNAQTPEAKAMKTARENVYPEYRTTILLLNAYAAIDANAERYQSLIRTLNANIDYLRKHAMSKGSSGDEPTPTPDGGSTGGDVTPVAPEA